MTSAAVASSASVLTTASQSLSKEVLVYVAVAVVIAAMAVLFALKKSTVRDHAMMLLAVLAVAMVIFIFGVLSTTSSNSEYTQCFCVTVAMHFFVVLTFMTCGCMALPIVNSSHSMKDSLKCFVAAVIVDAVVVVASAAPRGYLSSSMQCAIALPGLMCEEEKKKRRGISASVWILCCKHTRTRKQCYYLTPPLPAHSF